MNLKVVLPTSVLLERTASKIVAEGEAGSFCLLPRHLDLVAPLAPGLLSLTSPERGEEYAAVDEGILVKCGDEVLVSTRNAVFGGSLGTLRETIKEKYLAVEEQERQARSAAAKLEADFVRRFLQLEGRAFE